MMDVEAFALHNAFELNHPDAMTGVVGLLNIGHDVTNINILDEGVPLLTRDLAVGTRRIREDLQRERGLGVDEAQELLQGYDRSPHLDAVLEGRGEEIAVGIERAAAFLAQNSRAGTMRAIYTCGGGARIPGLNEALANRLHITVRQANPLANLKVRDGALEDPRDRRDRAAAHDADRAGAPEGRMIHINLLPGATKKNDRRRGEASTNRRLRLRRASRACSATGSSSERASAVVLSAAAPSATCT